MFKSIMGDVSYALESCECNSARDGQSLNLPGVHDEGERTPLREGASRVLEPELYGGIVIHTIRTTTVHTLTDKERDKRVNLGAWYSHKRIHSSSTTTKGPNTS